MVPGRGEQGGGHARGHPHPAFLPHRPAVRAARRLPQGRGAAYGDMVSCCVVANRALKYVVKHKSAKLLCTMLKKS